MVSLDQAKRQELLAKLQAAESELLDQLPEGFAEAEDAVAVGFVLRLVRSEGAAEVFRKHEEPLVSLAANLELAKAGDRDASEILARLMKQDMAPEHAAIVRTAFAQFGITPQDSPKQILDYLKELGQSDKLELGESPPAFKVPDLHGEEVSIESLAGKPVLLHFWATWCGPCMQEMEGLAEELADLPRNRVQVIFVSLDYDRKMAEVAIPKLGIECRHVVSGRGLAAPLSRAFRVRSLPCCVLLDSEMRVISYRRDDLFKILR